MDTILFELNEVPFRVLDAYIARRPTSAIAELAKASTQFITICEDEVELDPWISWPTLHRGVNDKRHGILHLGQMLQKADSEYPPIWCLLHKAGQNVGVFGSVHSSHLPEDVADYAFYVPDFFDDEVFAHPSHLVPFQRFNLQMTRRSARNVDTGISKELLADFLRSAPRLGLSASTVQALAAQLVQERRDPRLRIRRRSLQGLMMQDVFLRLLRSTRPNFASFYTNHVAAAMHRYWAAAFPEDFDPPVMSAEWTKTYSGEIWSAMDILDSMLRKLRAYADRMNYRLVIATSMGQHAVNHQPTRGFVGITDVGKFMTALGFEANQFRQRHAMVPCNGVVVPQELIESLTTKLDHISVNGKRFVCSDNEVAPMSYGVYDGGFVPLFTYFENYGGPSEVMIGNKAVPFAEAGWGETAHEDGVSVTGHHTSEGLMLVYNSLSRETPPQREEVSTLQIAPAILGSFGLTPPSYMRETGEALERAFAAPVMSQRKSAA